MPPITEGALLTSTSSRPCFAAVSAIRAANPATSATSSATPVQLPPLAVIAATSSSSFGLRPGAGHYMRALCGQLQRRTATDTHTAAGDNGYLVLKAFGLHGAVLYRFAKWRSVLR